LKIFNHAVIDHVYDIDAFISKIIDVCRKYAYISSYMRYFSYLESHKMRWDVDGGCYFNKVSIKQARKILQNKGLRENEFTMRTQEWK